LNPSIAAWPGGFTEIFAARPLQHIAAEARHVAKLAAGGEFQTFGQEWTTTPDIAVVGCFTHANQRPEANGIILYPDLPQGGFGESVEIDQSFRLRDTELHVVGQIGAAGDELRGGLGRRNMPFKIGGHGDRCGDADWSFIDEGAHPRPS
jgi:hypothetical protein